MDYLLSVIVGYGALVAVALIYGIFVRSATNSWGAAFRSAFAMAFWGAMAYFALRFTAYSFLEQEVQALHQNHPWVMAGVPAALEVIIVALAYQYKWLWKGPERAVYAPAGGSTARNGYWGSVIPFLNNATLCLSLLAFAASVVIVIGSPGLAPFLIPMAVALVLLFSFRYHEERILRPRLEYAPSGVMDTLLLLVIIARNLVLLANTIPVVQLLGLMAAMFAGIPILILYFAFVWVRVRGVAAPATPSA